MMFNYRNSPEKWKTPRESWRMPLEPPFASVVEPIRKPRRILITVISLRRMIVYFSREKMDWKGIYPIMPCGHCPEKF
ncbi:hypothetical protein NPIL_369281 [Nephila pilipes]|uniref:Uncharacterized protein n=1 Tax=Nephila pilipes TaxID=299642 RepID=A0A8X6NTJ3_NEPPI|nr:hypothetical protein NPIL_369281 [Nephila pilipes]